MHNSTTTVAAVSTPPGKGGVALIRISGCDAFAVADRVFYPKNGRPLSEHMPNMQTYGDIFFDGEPIDDGMATRFAAPHSYTGEDTVEITCHGGVLVTATVLKAVLAAGALLADPGEFTERAFVNGKLTLTDAEGVGQLLDAATVAGLRLSRASARAGLSEKIGDIRRSLVDLMSSIYARIDYPDEDLGEFSDGETAERLKHIRAQVCRLIGTYRTGHAVAEGIRTVICGKPNAGKSSLYNALLGETAAIVTDIAGTTRDTLTARAAVGPVLLHLTDTAGLRETDDPVEKMGVARAREKLAAAELILCVFDLSRPADAEDADLVRYVATLPAKKIAVLNKSDLPVRFHTDGLAENFSAVVTVSAEKGDTEALTDCIRAMFTDGEISLGEDAVVTTARQEATLLRARDFMDTALAAYGAGMAADAASSDLELAIGALSETDGRQVSEDIVADIFSKFCVGK